MEKTIEEQKKAYLEIVKVTEKYKHFNDKYSIRDINDMYLAAKNHLMRIDWYEKYGIKLDKDAKLYEHNWFRVSEYLNFSHFGDAQKDKDVGSGRFISWSDDGRQPNDEWLLNIGFSTGAYIFGDDYELQKPLFQDFIEELKSYKPKYSDTVNKNFYWGIDDAKAIFEAFPGILKKYQERNRAEFDERKAKKLRAELEKLEAKKTS